MNHQPNIRLIHNKGIDKAQWDESLHHCSNKMIYAESVYLDHMASGWSVLIQEDGAAIMPLPIKKKLGIVYAFQPPFTQQLGVFCAGENSCDINSFITKAAHHAPLMDMNFNYANEFSAGKKYCNYVLDLSWPFTDLKKKFRKDLVSKAEAKHLVYDEAQIDDSINAYIDEIFPRTKGLTHTAVERFRSLCHHYNDYRRVVCRKVLSSKNEILGHALFLNDETRIYYMLSATSNNGRAVDANAFLLHEVIREFSEKPMLFDFEGSEIPGVKFFFEKFSPMAQPYTRVRVNELKVHQRIIKSFRDIVRK